MFCTTLRRRPSLSILIPLLTSSTAPKLHETTLQTHDLALRLPTHSSSHGPQQQQRPTTQAFLILTASTLHSTKTADDRIRRFSTLTADPTPTILFLLSTSPSSSFSDDSEGIYKLMELQTFLQTLLPTPPPLLPIPHPSHLLHILQSYTATTGTPTISPTPKPTPTPLSLLPHVTTTAPLRPLSTHTTNVLSDLCHSLKEVIESAETEGGREVLGEWLGGEEGRGIGEFWEGEWIVE